jgi:hypothetical protein
MPAMAGFELTELERKLLRLALCESAQPGEVLTSGKKLIASRLARAALTVSPVETASAQPGEVLTSGKKLIESWRARGVDSVAVETALSGGSNGAEAAIQMSRPDYGLTRMPFGKHNGEMFMDIPPGYLRFIRRWINDAPERATRFKDQADAIEQFPQQT